MTSPRSKSDAFCLERCAGTAVLRFRASLFDIARDLRAKESLLAAISRIGRDQDVKALVVFVPPTGLNPEAYAEFLRHGPDTGTPDGATRYNTALDVQYAQEENALAQVVLAVHQLKRVTIACLRGRMAAPFVGASLAFDFRLACEDVRFALNDTLLGVPPGGAIGFFLPRYVGCGKAVELLLLGEPLSAGEALALGLVNVVYTETDFEDQCMAWAERVSRMPLSVVVGMKSLCQAFPEAELSQYLKMETEIMRQSMLEHWALLHPRSEPGG